MQRRSEAERRRRADAVVDLDDRHARDPAVAGSKAAALATAAAAGLPVLPGFVVTTTADPGGDAPAIREAWEALSDHGSRSLVVRSSSTVEDAPARSMAGRFDSLVDVRGWEAFRDAVAQVRASAGMVGDPMGVLVQPYLPATTGGVLFGADPITGDDRRLVVECVSGTPGELVAGTVSASRYVLGPGGRLRSGPTADAPSLDRRRRRALARIARDARNLFGSPQDLEWALDRDGAVWLLQSRPITATGDAVQARGPTLGPGPVGETFPDPLRPLEQDLFAAPLREGMVRALHAIGATSRRRIEHSPVLILVGNRVAADLDLLGWSRRRRRPIALLNPTPGLRRLVAAWHVGRLRRMLPAISDTLVAAIDIRLAQVPPLRELDDAALLDLLERTADHLVAVHGHQVLAGMLLPQADDRPSATALAIPAVAAARASGSDDAAIVAGAPIVLTLVPPRVGPPSPLPEVPEVTGTFPPPRAALGAREGLRLRARWLDELSARAATELGRRLVADGRVPDQRDVRELTLAELSRIVEGGPAPLDLTTRRRAPDGAPLPAAFRLTPAGTVVAVRGADPPTGRGAGGGRGEGPVVHENDAVTVGGVLVVRVLSPTLAPLLPALAGLVAETGSILSHLAILAREQGVPTVVAVDDAMERFPVGAHVIVDGTTGEVQRVEVPTPDGGAA